MAGETTLHKRVFSPFANPELAALLKKLGSDTVIVAGVHTHTCVRQAALDAYQLGFTTWVASEAVGSYEPLEAAQTELYLQRRGIATLPTREILDRLDGNVPPEIPDQSTVLKERINAAVRAARPEPGDPFASKIRTRLDVLEKAAQLLEERAPQFAAQLTADIHKPIRFARGEVDRAVQLFRVVARRAGEQKLEKKAKEARVCRRPLGVVALVTPWNNPLAIPAGQLAPALAYGNAVVWKPAPAGLAMALEFQKLLRDAGLPESWMQIANGGDDAGLELIAHRGVDAVAFTGSSANGWKVMHVCASQHKPLQAELGGNNGAIVCADCADLDDVARQIAEAAFAFAGQRCTATRRVIVLEPIYDAFVALLKKSTAAMAWGAAEDENTQVGPLLAAARVERVASIVSRAKADAFTVLQPHVEASTPAAPVPKGATYFPPSIVLCDQPDSEIVQEETFGPVLVVQRARDWEQAIGLLNGVRQGLAAACFTSDGSVQEQFLAEARAGILKINRATADAGVDVPFGGWKGSGVGTPQHGPANVEFYTRFQTVYSGERG